MVKGFRVAPARGQAQERTRSGDADLPSPHLPPRHLSYGEHQEGCSKQELTDLVKLSASNLRARHGRVPKNDCCLVKIGSASCRLRRRWIYGEQLSSL